MNLLQTIHNIWAADANLALLLPATSDKDTNKVWTGLDFDPELPFASLEKLGGTPEQYDACGRGTDRVAIRVQIFVANHKQGQQIVNAVKAAFDRTDFDLYGGDSSSSGEDTDDAMNMQRTNDAEFQEEDGTWRFVLDFDVWVDLTKGY